MVLLTLRGPYITVEVGDGDGVSRPPTRAFDGVFENNLLRFVPVRSPPLAQSTLANGQQRGTPLVVVDIIKAKVIRIELRLCVGEEVGRKGIRASGGGIQDRAVSRSS